MAETYDAKIFQRGGVTMVLYPDGDEAVLADVMRYMNPGMEYDQATGEALYAAPPPAEAGADWKPAQPYDMPSSGLLASQPEDQGSATGFPELDRMLTGLGNINQMLNPVEGIGQSMDASRRMLAPDTAGWDRVAALGDMLSGIAGVVAPVAAAARAGTPAAMALMEGLLGWSPTSSAAKDTAKSIARTVAERANQRGPVPVMGSNLANLLGESVIGGMKQKVDKVSDMVRSAYGVTPSVSYHPTKFGNSAYFTAKIPGPGNTFSTVGFRLSDHDIGDFRRQTDQVQTIIDEGSITPEELFSRVDAQYSQSLPSLQKLQIESASKKALSENSLQMWGGLSSIQKENIAKSYAQDSLRPGKFNKPWKYLSQQDKAEYASLIGQQPPPQGLLGDTLPAPRNEAEAIAKDILELRATGNVDAVTESMMNAADPQYMYNYTPLPMDQASRMARAGDIGFPRDDWYHGTNQDIGGFQGNTFTADNPTLASTYARGITDAQTYPLLLRSKLSTTPVDAGGQLWSQIPIQTIDDPAVASWLDPNALQSTRSIESAAVKEGRSGVRFKDVLDIGPGFDSQQFKRAGYSPDEAEAMRLEYLRQLDTPATVDVRLSPNQVRSRFARFDPMFAHLRNLSAGVAISPLAYGLLSDQYERENRK